MGALYTILSRRGNLKPDIAHQIIEANGWWNPPHRIHKTDPTYLIGVDLFDSTKSREQHILLDQVIVVGDIRIDNHADLRSEYHDIQVHWSDWDIVAYLYMQCQMDLLHKIVGSFTLIIFDLRSRTLFAAVDHMGTKPLYYHIHNDYLVLGTQKKTCTCCAPLARIPNWEYLFENILYYEHLEESTEYLNIKKIAPGSFLKLDQSGIEVKRYWSLDTELETRYSNENDYIDRFIELFEQAVACRINGVAKAGGHLSGGLDSSGIMGVASSLSNKTGCDIRAFSYTVPDDVNAKDDFVNDNPLIHQQAEFAGIPLTKIDTVISRKRRHMLEMEATRLDGFAEMNKLNIEYEMQAALQKEHIRICLSGFLGDELVTSFATPYYLEYLQQGKYLKLLAAKHQGKLDLKSTLGPLWYKVLNKVGIWDKQKIANVYHKRKYKLTQRKKEWKDNLFDTQYVNKELMDRVYAENDRSEYLYGFPLSHREHQKNHAHRRITSVRMCTENLSGLNFHVEYRYPLADIRLMQYVLSLPVEMKRSETMNRRIYRLSMKKYITPDILRSNNKVGHVKPMSIFYKNKSWQSVANLYYYLREKKLLPYLDNSNLESYLKQGKMPPHFNTYLMYGLLADQGKMVF